MNKFIEAIKNNDINKIIQLLDNYQYLNIPNIDGTTLLYNAVFYNKIEIVRLLLEKGADLNIENAFDGEFKNYSGGRWNHYTMKPISLANDANKEVIKILIKYGASPDFHHKNNGLSGVYNAILNKDIEYIAFLLNNGANLENSNSYSIKEKEASLNDETLNKLHCDKLILDLLFHNNSLEFISQLVQHVDNINILLCYSIKKDTKEITSFLIDKSSDLNKPSKVHYNRTPLDYAVTKDEFEITEALLKKGANPQFLAIACERQNFKIVKLLIEYNIDVNQLDNDGELALYYAVNAKKANKEIIRFLIKNGADINKENSSGISPLSFAESSKVSLVKVLMESVETKSEEVTDNSSSIDYQKINMKIISQNRVINKLKDVVKVIENDKGTEKLEDEINALKETVLFQSDEIKELLSILMSKEENTKNLVEHLTLKINKLEKKFDKQKIVKNVIPINIPKEKQSIKKDDGIIVKREPFDDF